MLEPAGFDRRGRSRQLEPDHAAGRIGLDQPHCDLFAERQRASGFDARKGSAEYLALEHRD